MSTKLLSPELEIDLHKEEEQDESIKKGERRENNHGTRNYSEERE